MERRMDMSVHCSLIVSILQMVFGVKSRMISLEISVIFSHCFSVNFLVTYTPCYLKMNLIMKIKMLI